MLVGELVAAGLEVHIGLAVGHRFNLPAPFLKAQRHIRHVHLLDGTSGSKSGREYAISKLVRQLNPDIVLPLRLLDALEWLAINKSRFKYRIVYAIHEYRAEYFQDLINFGGAIDAVVCCDALSRLLVREIAHIPENRIHVVPQGVDVPEAIASIGHGERLRIGYMGRLEQDQKRVSDIAELAGKLRSSAIDFRIVIAGDGPERAAMENRLRACIERKQVIFCGWLSQERLSEFLQREIDVLLITSSWETGPIVAWQAMAHGVPVVTSRYRGLEQAGFLKHRENCMVFPVGDMEIALEHILALLTDLRLRDAIVKKAREDVCAARQITAIASRWRDLFSGVLQNTPVIPDEGAVRSQTGEGRGRLERMGIPISVIEFFKKKLHYRFPHASPGEEWPFYSSPNGGTVQALAECLGRYDR